MNRNPLLASISWRMILSLVLVVALSLAIVPLDSQAVRSKPVAVPVPVLTSPANGTTTTVANYPPQAIPAFQWQAVTGATAYRIQFADNIGFSPVQYEATTATNQLIPTSDGVFRDTTWYWRVRVESPSVGDYSYPWQFTRSWGNSSNAPNLLSPSSGASVEFFEGSIFSWTPVIGAASYRLKISTGSPDCSSNIVTNLTTLTTRYNLAERLVNGTYYWCVIPLDAK